MIYIRKLELCDEDNNPIFKIENTRASKGLNKALIFVNQKEGISKKDAKKSIWRDLDNEFKNYFSMD